MAKTPLTAALLWTGQRFDCVDPPAFLVHALGAGSIAFDGETLGVTTGAGPVSIGAGDYIAQSEADGLLALTADDFNENYEITA